MHSNHRERLRGIRTFPSLVKYLREELDWPIRTDDFDKLTFEYTPEELGISSRNAAKIQEIRRLRPLADNPTNQPWGIFFVKFEPKRLPVGALRLILGRVALKKRASSNSDERAAWRVDDLLFISNYGEAGERSISFAHFAPSESDGRVPVLNVLGWDSQDTALHIDDVAETLSEKLRWPSDEADLEAWRESWRAAFTLRHREVVTTSRALAVRLALLARRIRSRINDILAIESDEGPTRTLMSGFQQSLVHDLDEDGFADMYAQTIAYGLLSARVASPSEHDPGNLASVVPVTNPFLCELMETFLDTGGQRGGGLDFDEIGVGDVVDLLDAAKMDAVVRDFGDRNPQDDPVIHFYELFLSEYDARKRMQRGVFYTPRPVVSYIVRSVDELLRCEFGLKDGLADTATWGEMTERFSDLETPAGATPDQSFVQVLDPATGTGTFLVEVIGLVNETMVTKWEREGRGASEITRLWNEYVPRHLLPRLHGYELMMAPYAIAHMKIGLKLRETGYLFESDERARVYLTNSLEPAHDVSGTLAFAIPALAHEVQAVNAEKRDRRFTVVVGNPPYSSSSQNTGEWAMELIEDYKTTVRRTETQIQALSDDYVKFLRYAQHCTEQAHAGVVGFITNNNYLSGTTFRDMRHGLLRAFTFIHVTDLHGNGRIKERAPDGSLDENVFDDILTGVCVAILGRVSSSKPTRQRTDMFGTRHGKYKALTAQTALTSDHSPFSAKPPQFEFRTSDSSLDAEYGSFAYLPELFGSGDYLRDKTVKYGSGFKTQQDEFAIAFSERELVDKVSFLLSADVSETDVRSRFTMCSTSQWDFARARMELGSLDWRRLVTRCLYRPFDERFTVLHRGVVSNPRTKVMSQFLKPNLGLCVGRQGQVIPGDWSVVFCTRFPEDQNLFCRGGNTSFPLYWYTEETELGLEPKQHNLSKSFLRSLASRLAVEVDASSRMPNGLEPEDVFQYVYAVLHSCEFRRRYAEFLKVDFPRIPLPAKRGVFDALVALGRELVELHTCDHQTKVGVATPIGVRGEYVAKVSYSQGAVWIDEQQTRGFQDVPEGAWHFQVGGYQICEKWLKDRRAKGGKNPRPGRVLTDEDVERYQKIVVALVETTRIMNQVDDAIGRHGGWPGAFQTSDAPPRQ